MNTNRNLLFIIFLLLCLINCTPNNETTPPSFLEESTNRLRNYDSLAQSSIMIVGTFHFTRDVLDTTHQKNVLKLIQALSLYQPTKIVLEWEPSLSEIANHQYRSFLVDSFDLSTRYNEVYQLGFRLAQTMNHDSLYFLDNKTEYIGSLENFSFDSFAEYANKNDEGFYDKHETALTEIYIHNQNIFNSHDLYHQIALRNSPPAQRINKQRMHMYEIRVGIQKNWIGPDWLGRWYQRNIRMAGNVLKMNKNGDRILVIVGDNHKWTLDMLFENIPDFEVVSSWDYLSN